MAPILGRRGEVTRCHLLLSPTVGRACPSWGQGRPGSEHPDSAPLLQPGALWLVPARGRARCFVWMAQHFG